MSSNSGSIEFTEHSVFSDRIVQIPLNELKAADYNPRPQLKFSNPEKFEKLKASMRRGLFKPIIVNKRTGNTVSGHQRVDAARDMGWRTIPGLYIDVDLHDEKRINIADNVEWSSFEKDLLTPLLYDEAVIPDLPLLGFSDDMLIDFTQDLGDLPDDIDDDSQSLGAKTGLHTLRLILSGKQFERVQEILEFLTSSRSFANGENPNEKGNAAFHVFELFWSAHIGKLSETVQDGHEESEGDR